MFSSRKLFRKKEQTLIWEDELSTQCLCHFVLGYSFTCVSCSLPPLPIPCIPQDSVAPPLTSPFPSTPGGSALQVVCTGDWGLPAKNLLLLVWASEVSFPFVVTVQMPPLREIFLEI